MFFALALTFIITAEAAAGPDLAATSIIIRSRPHNNTYYPGDSFSVDCAVENVGDETLGEYSVQIHAGNYDIGSASGGSLEPGQTDMFLVTCSLPSDIPPGTHLVEMEVSCPGDTDPGNDTTSDGYIRVDEKSPPDISIQSVNAAKGVYLPGDSIIVTISLNCSGGQLPGSCNIEVYASEDMGISADDSKISSLSLGSLQPGELYSIDTEGRFPLDIVFGDYYIGINATYPTRTGTATAQAWDSTAVYVGEPSNIAVESVDAADGTFLLGEQIAVRAVIKNVSNQTSSPYAVQYYLSSDSVITDTDIRIGRADRGSLSAGERHSFDTSCLLPENLASGNYYIGAIVTCSSDTSAEDNVGYDHTQITVVLPPGTVCGQMKYTDLKGGEHPIRYAMVKIYDAGNKNNPPDDRLLVQTFTGRDGNFGFIMPDGSNSEQIYLRVFTQSVSGAYPQSQSSIGRVQDDVFREVYFMESGLYPPPGDSYIAIDMTAPNSVGEFMVFDSLVEGFDKAKTFFGLDLDAIAVNWPSSADATYYDPCNVEISISREDRSDRDVIMHEYGHYIAQTQNFAQGSVGDNGIHYWNADLRIHPTARTSDEAMHLAFRESWASLFGIATQYGDTSYPNSGDTKYQDYDETADKTFAVDLERKSDYRYFPGEYFENMNCGALWDIFDDSSAGDDYLDMLSDTSLARIWALLLSYKLDKITDFWDAWCESYGYDNKIKYIFEEHEMPFKEPKPPEVHVNHPPFAYAGEDQVVEQTHAAGAAVTLSGSGSDPDGDEIECRWECDDFTGFGSTITPTLGVGETTATFVVYDGEFYVSDSVNITVLATDPSTWTDP